jgi:endo-1,4-beta-D-glucanase Y
MNQSFWWLSFAFVGAACAPAPLTQGQNNQGGSATGGGGSAGAAAGGSAGIAGAGSIFDSPPSPPTATAHFPFPQNRAAASCVYPTAATNTDMTSAYDHWKALVVTANGAAGELRVQRTSESSFDTVSEGIGYGMIVSVYMNDQTTFDKLWRYSQKWLDSVGIMNWQISSAGAVMGRGSATDGDEDMAWALVMADRQWGGQGTLTSSYIDLAKGLIAKMWQYDVDHGRGEMLKPGDGWMEDKTNPSYFAPAYYRVFAAVTGDANWMKVVDASYSILAQALTHGNADNGLVPDWCSSGGSPLPNGSSPPSYSYDACRTPFRIALDACLFDEPRAKSYLAKTSQFFSGIGASNIKDGYSLTGTPTGKNFNPAFLGPATVGSMTQPADGAFLKSGYASTAGLTRNDGYYYNTSWGVLSLLMMTGNFLDYSRL